MAPEYAFRLLDLRRTLLRSSIPSSLISHTLCVSWLLAPFREASLDFASSVTRDFFRCLLQLYLVLRLIGRRIAFFFAFFLL